MNLDPVTRLAALHSPTADVAILLRLPIAEIGECEDPQTVIENALDAFVERIEAALCDGHEEVVLSLQVAELVAIALKSRKKTGRSAAAIARSKGSTCCCHFLRSKDEGCFDASRFAAREG